MIESSITALPQIMRLPEVMNTVGLSKPSIYRLMAEGAFPRQVGLGAASVGWLRSEVEAWIAARVSARDAGTMEQAKLAA